VLLYEQPVKQVHNAVFDYTIAERNASSSVGYVGLRVSRGKVQLFDYLVKKGSKDSVDLKDL
jgi:hypothetical protein